MGENSTYQLIGVLSTKDQLVLGRFRNDKRIEIAFYEESYWLRVEHEIPWVEGDLQQIPFQNIYVVGENNYLFPLGKKTPTALLPELLWQSINDFLKVELPVSAEQGQTNDVYFVDLIHCNEHKEGKALLVSFENWKKYTENNVTIRFEKLRFATSIHQEALITGYPLPSIQGKEFWECENMWLPAGYHFRFPVLASKIHEKLNPNHNLKIVFFEDGTWLRIPLSDFVETSRSAIHLTEKDF